jgi:hypothetical protein
MSPNNEKNDTGINPAATLAGRVGNYRWVICALLFFCTTINYIDRNSLSVLKTTLQGALGWTDVDYGWITFAFTFAYAAFPSLIGVFVDRFGVKRALAGALVLWSVAAAAHGLVATVLGFVIVRFVLGIAEAANFPASIKAVGMWFPQKERALATGIFNSGTSVGVMVSFLTVWIAGHWGWQGAFVFIGVIGLIWLFFWQKYFDIPEKQKRLGQARARVHPGRSSRRRESRQGSVDRAAALPGNLAVHHRQVHHRSGVVVLPVLAAVVPRTRARPESADERVVDRCDLHRFFRRLHPRRLAVGRDDQARLGGRQGAHDHDVVSRHIHARLHLRVLRRQLRRLRGIHHARDRVPPGLVRQSVHQRHRHVPAEGVRVGRRPRRHRRRHRRHVHDLALPVSPSSGPAISRSSSSGAVHAPARARAVLVLVQGPLRAGRMWIRARHTGHTRVSIVAAR